MPQSPPERKLDSAEPPRKASVIPFERPQNDAQRTIRKRVQERLDRETVRIQRPRIAAGRIALTLAIALIPVVLTFTSADAILRRIQLLTRLYTSPQATSAAPATPAEPEDPGVVIMMPDPGVSAGDSAANADAGTALRSAHAAPNSSSHQ